MANDTMTDDKSSFKKTPGDEYRKWMKELSAAKKYVEHWHAQAEGVISRYKGSNDDELAVNYKRANFFHADTEIWKATLFGNIPNVAVKRKFLDPNDDLARVSGVIRSRVLNNDVERDGDTYVPTLRYALHDWLVPGMAWAKLRYEFEPGDPIPGKPAIKKNGKVLAPAVPEQPTKKSESVEIDYVHWKDVLWSPCRVWSECRWVGFAADMTMEKATQRFGKEIARQLPYGKQDKNEKKPDPVWGRAKIWEIHDKETRRHIWLCEGYPQILDVKDDPLGLRNFWSCPAPLVANPSTDESIPVPFYIIAQDIYTAIDELFDRIIMLEQSLKVTGVYDSASPDIKRMMEEDSNGKLFPADNWAMLAEKGGIKGSVDWFPLEMISATLDKLSEKLNEKVGLLQQITGTADLMRGQAQQMATATEQSIKAKFAGVRSDARQKEFARFASDIQRIKGEIIAKHFDPKTILDQSNIMNTPDAPLAMQAVQLMKTDHDQYRISVEPESVSFQDYAQIKQDRAEVLQALATFMPSMAVLTQALGPAGNEAGLELIKWAVAALPGSSEMEGVLDRAIEQWKQAQKQAAMNPQPPPPDPKVEAAKVKAQADGQKAQLDLQKTVMSHQADMQKIQLEHQANLARIDKETVAAVTQQAAQAEYNIKEEAAKARLAHHSSLADNVLKRDGREDT